MREEFVPCPVFDSDSPFKVLLAGISYCDGSYRIVRKSQNLACVEYIIDGEGTILTDKKAYHPQRGDTYLLQPYDNHEYFSSSDNPWVKIWLNVSGAVVNSLIDAYSLRDIYVFRCNTEKYFRQIHAILLNKELTQTDISAQCAIVFHKLLQALAKSIETHTSVQPEAEMLKSYIDTNIYKTITVDELAGLIYKSPAHTIRLFKKVYGITPYEYYMNNRIKKAISLLKDTMFSVKEIAYMLGFCDEHYFSNIFRQRTGKRPTDYR